MTYKEIFGANLTRIMKEKGITQAQLVKELGMDNRKTYKRHGRKYYRPYRNYWCGEEPALEWFSKMGLAEKEQEEGKLPYYYLTRQGMDWLERRIGVVIREEET